MGEALIRGLYKSHCLFICEANGARAHYLAKKYGIKIKSETEGGLERTDVTVSDLSTVVKSADVIVLAVKPQDMIAILEQIKSFSSVNKVYISVAAGLTTKFFEKALGGKVRVLRFMPNMPGLIGQGITGVCLGHYAKSADLELAKPLLAILGETMVIRESMMDSVTAISGSGPAYVFLFVEAWIAAAKKLGFKEAEAKLLVYKTLLGSAKLLNQAAWTASELRVKVTSKGGTTQAAMDVFSKAKFDGLIYKALLAAKKRAKELAK